MQLIVSIITYFIKQHSSRYICLLLLFYILHIMPIILDVAFIVQEETKHCVTFEMVVFVCDNCRSFLTVLLLNIQGGW